MDYLDWNDAIGRRFFNEDMGGREVLLYVNEETINSLGAETGEGVKDFIECIKKGPPWATREGICQKALQIYSYWKINRQGLYPQYLAYLACFVLAGTTGGDFDPKAYYPRLRQLLGEPSKTGTYPSFDRMEELWSNLEKWSQVYKHEELGRFTKRVRGGNIHIGLPLSQTLLSEDERRSLPYIFNEAGFDPTNIPSEMVVARALLKYGKGKLLQRTLNLLKEEKNDTIGMANALIEFVIEEIAEWDGTLLEAEEIEGPTKMGQPTAMLRVCIDLDRVSNAVTSTLRFKINRPFPDGELEFEYGDQAYSCKETNDNWSTPIRDSAFKDLDAAKLDWLKGAVFEDKETGWKAVLRPAHVRLFLRIPEEVSEWVESQHLERECNFLIVCHGSKENLLQSWGIKSCKSFEKRYVRGLPNEWLLFEGNDPREPCQEFEVLALPTILRLRLLGGIKVKRTNNYLKFGPPLIVLEGGDGNERITINDHEIFREDPFLPCWHIPADAPVGEPLNIEVFSGEKEPLQKRLIQLVEPELADTLDEAPKRDRSGTIMADATEPFARGAVVEGCDPVSLGILPPTLPTYLSRRIVFIGSRPGEVADWPRDALPENWLPVWALAKSGKDKWVVHFCAHQSYTECSPGSPLEERRAVKRWIEAIWMKRRRTKEPELRCLRQLWGKYREAAKYA